MLAEGLRMVISDEGIATVYMINGENRFRMSFVKAWSRILDEVEKNQDIKGLIITGHEKIFSLGLDVTYFATQSPEYVTTTRTAIAKLYQRLLFLPIPTVAAINGHAFGAGAFLAVMCDYRVMNADRGWICWPEVTLEMRLMPQSLELIRVKIPLGKATRDAILFGQNLTGPEAHDLRIVDAITDSAHLEMEALSFIKETLGKTGLDRQALQQAKKDVHGYAISESSKL
ncbi:hypothetical protein DPMN_170294 [Dreissena polymorpha]|uniref:Uncharacterized protein n=2 Tax=Dreissena polymorpha TaxID=45954 RepID=A0A9D4DVX0_DREPO|nr:hypothetical protein DPMN_170294 [Dreissena polymorpha]